MNNHSMDNHCPFDPMSPQVWRNPYPFYAALRQRKSVAWVEPESRWHLLLGGGMTSARGFWMLTSFEEISKAMLLADLGHHPPGRAAKQPSVPLPSASGTLTAIIEDWSLFSDSPEHGRLKRPLARAVARWPFTTLQALAHDVAAKRLEEMEKRSTFDIVQDFGDEIPMRVISTLIGVDEADHPMLTAWSHALYAALEFGAEEDTLQDVDRRLREALDYFRTLLVARRVKPREDLISLLSNAGDGQRLSDDEILSNCILLLFAGHDTTLNVIGNTARTLLTQPHHLDRFVAKAPDRDDLLEFLRHESPQQLVFRYALRDFQISGQTISEGDLVCLAIGAANRDPTVFEKPDDLDFDRRNRQYLTFGKGIHTCPGSSLGLAISGASLHVLIPHLARLDAKSWDWGSNAIMRGLRSLVVSWRTAPVA